MAMKAGWVHPKFILFYFIFFGKLEILNHQFYDLILGHCVLLCVVLTVYYLNLEIDNGICKFPP